MISLSQIGTELVTAIKSRNQLEADTLRALKTRIQNEQIAKGRELSEAELVGLAQSEVKKRKEAVESYTAGGRPELADKELAEVAILSHFLPVQASEQEIGATVDKLQVLEGWTAADFGKAMGLLKARFGATADGQTLARILKEKLK